MRPLLSIGHPPFMGKLVHPLLPNHDQKRWHDTSVIQIGVMLYDFVGGVWLDEVFDDEAGANHPSHPTLQREVVSGRLVGIFEAIARPVAYEWRFIEVVADFETYFVAVGITHPLTRHSVGYRMCLGEYNPTTVSEYAISAPNYLTWVWHIHERDARSHQVERFFRDPVNRICGVRDDVFDAESFASFVSSGMTDLGGRNVNTDDALCSAFRHFSTEIARAATQIKNRCSSHITASIEHRRPEKVKTVVVKTAFLEFGVRFRCYVPLATNRV